jgi:hypothetical protein
MATLQELLGGGLPAGLLSPEQEAAAERRAQNAALLNFAFGALQASRGAPGQGRPGLGQIIGQAGPVGVQAYQQSFDQTLTNALRGMQIGELRRKQAEEERARQARTTFEQQLAGATRTIPTPAAFTAQQSNIAPEQLEGMSAQQVAQQAVQAGLPTQQVMDQNAADQAVMNYLRVAAPTEYAKLVTREPRALPEALQRYQLAVAQGYKGTLLDFEKELKKQEPSPRQGLNDEMKIRSAFTGEPVYKAYQEMQSAYGQITESLKKGTPAGDLAGATKFMKLLDPGSVVRESELYLAMQASGALDRFTNYANMKLSGQKLTADQRKDFQQLADKLYGAAVGAYNAKRKEYVDLAVSYDLNPNRSVGPAATFSIDTSQTPPPPSAPAAKGAPGQSLRSILFPNRG